MFNIKTSQRLITSIAAMCVGMMSYAAELRESVCYVRESNNASLNYENLANALQNKSYIAASKKVREYTGGDSFGSGFVIKDEKGKLVVVTNKHVVHDAKYVDLTFEVNGAEVKYARCPVVYVSKNLDIALVNFPSDNVNVPALKINKNKVKDGSDVWTAGYPALGDKPSWQLGKGVMSNNSVKDEFFGDIDSVAVYQHTAQVDPGSSGGPLLVMEKSGDYTVVGINTWKASFRENTNFSIPIKYYNNVSVNEMSVASTSKDNIGDVEKIAKQFLDDVKKNDADLSSYVATEALLGMDEGILSVMLDKASETRRIQLRTKSPIPVMKSIVGDFAFDGVKSMADVEYSSTVKDGENYKTTYVYKGKEIGVVWKENMDGYKIVSSSSSSAENVEKIQKSKESKVIYSQEWNRYLELSFSKGLEDHFGQKADLTFMIMVGKYFLFGPRVELGHTEKHLFADPDFYTTDIIEKDDTTYMIEKSSFLGVEFSIGYQCPFKLTPSNKAFLTPYVIGDFGGVLTHDFNFEGSLHAGARLGYSPNKNKSVFVGAEYVVKKVTELEFNTGDDDGCKFGTRKYVAICVGFGF